MKNGFVVVIGASAGGSAVLPALLKQFSDEMNIVVLVAMHVAKNSIGEMMVKRMQRHTSYPCKIPAQEETLKRNHIYFCKPDHHLLLKDGKVLIGNGPVENRYRPSIDTLFRSAAAWYAGRAIGVILSGMLEDGSAGMMAIKRSGGSCIIQDPDEAQFPDMPNSVQNILKPDYTLPVAQMGMAISKILKSKKVRKKKAPHDILKEAEIAERINVGDFTVKPDGTGVLYSCPDCGGRLYEYSDGSQLRYRCHVGHAYGTDGLINGMEYSTESALWTALRIIEERKNLLQKLEKKESAKGNSTTLKTYSKRRKDLEQQENLLRQILFPGRDGFD
jgi:two-component system, chemotaxis family, protein-glutamate methylesterase/glutaminase